MPVVVMNTAISGTRNEAEWPPAGGTVEVSHSEAQDLVGMGLARPLVEAAVSSPAVETAAVDTRPARRRREPAGKGGDW